MAMRLYTYYRSSAAYRVRVALNLKGLAYEAIPVHLRKNEQNAAAYRTVNPQGLIPTLTEDGRAIGQSLAIIEYLEDAHPEPPLLPQEPRARARVRQIAFTIACDIHPLNNLRMLRHLKERLRQDDDALTVWQHHWMAEGFSAIETLLADSADTGRFCHGNTPGLADICLVPQLYNARRVGLDLAPYPTMMRIEAACQEIDAFAAAHPARQPDAE
jgi:maleylacetoacetate isomerase